MNKNTSTCLVILAGGQSTRMGTDKAVIKFGGQRLIDILIDRFASKSDQIFLSAPKDYGTGLDFICDDPGFPGGPVGGIFSVAAILQKTHPDIAGFVTVPIDAPRAPADLIARLSRSGPCTVARDHRRVHPTFAHWRCDMIDQIRLAYDHTGKAPSLHWLAERCGAKSVTWRREDPFMNINRPQDLIEVDYHKTADP